MNAPTVGIDARMWAHPGIGRYLRELSRHLAARTDRPGLCFLGGAQAEREIASFEASGISFRKASSPIYSLSEQVEITRRAADLELLHVPHFNIPVLRRKKTVVTVHDLIYAQDPAASRSVFGRPYARWLFRRIARTAAAVLVVSEATREDLLNAFPALSPERVFVTHEAAPECFRPVSDAAALEAVRRRHGLERPFVLFVGTLKAHKNVSGLVKAMAVLRERRGMEHELVLVGRPGDGIQTTPWVRALGQLPDEELVLLYNLADLFVLPSFKEGFGLPVLEAMACGTPVAASRVSSIPEVAGSAARFFDPDSVDALEEVLYTVLKDKDLRVKMSADGLERAAQFNWEKTAGQTLDVYHQVLN